MVGMICLGLAALGPLSPASQALMSNQSDQAAVLSALHEADIVYLGETHDSLADHEAQLEILQALWERGEPIALAMEMFQRPYQSFLDAYVAGEIDEAELIEKSQYEQRWGFPWEYYAPLLHFARANQLPVLALNTPTEITARVAREGLKSLPPEAFNYIPPLTEIDTANAAYRQRMESIYQHHAGHGSALSFENFFAAQVLWDETMAEGVARFRQAHPGIQVAVLAGQGHVVFGHGIPDRVARRLGEQTKQAIVILNPDAAIQGEAENGIADYFWFSEPTQVGAMRQMQSKDS